MIRINKSFCVASALSALAMNINTVFGLTEGEFNEYQDLAREIKNKITQGSISIDEISNILMSISPCDEELKWDRRTVLPIEYICDGAFWFSHSVTDSDLENTYILMSLGMSGENVSLTTLKDRENLTQILLGGTFEDIKPYIKLFETVGNEPWSIGLGCTKIDLALVNALMLILERNASLTTLHLYGFEMDLNAVTAFAEALRKNSWLNQLSLKDAPRFKFIAPIIKSLKPTFDQWELIDFFSFNGNLQELDLSGIGMADEDIDSLASMLKTNPSLYALRLKQVGIPEKGIVLITEALWNNNALRILCLNYNGIGESCGQFIGEMLKQNDKLVELDLSHNSIGAGVKDILEGLNGNSSITSLRLRENRIEDSEATLFGKALKVNSSIISLDLAENQIKDDGASSLSGALKHNSTLMRLVLGLNRIGDSGKKALADALESNLTITEL